MEENRLREEEDEEVARKKEAAKQLAQQKGLERGSPPMAGSEEAKPEIAEDESYPPQTLDVLSAGSEADDELLEVAPRRDSSKTKEIDAQQKDTFVPARLPFF
jgi:hypothetical protein